MKLGVIALGLLSVQGLAAQTNAQAWQDYLDDISPLIDYSYAGYHSNEKEIPDVSDLAVFDVTAEGAVANDEISDHSAIRSAVERASAAGGIVKFPAGLFITHADGDPLDESFEITGSNVVLRGAGNGQTIIWQKLATTNDPPRGFAVFKTEPSDGDPKSAYVLKDQSAGDTRLKLDSLVRIPDGAFATVSARLTDHDSISEFIRPLRPTQDNGMAELGRKGLLISEPIQILKRSGRVLTLKSPLAIHRIKAEDAADRWLVRTRTMLTEVGIEDLSIMGSNPPGFVHDGSKNDFWNAINLARCADCWVRDVSFYSVSRAISISGGLRVTVRDVQVLGNPGHYSTKVTGGARVLIQDLIDTTGQYHGPSLSHGASAIVHLRAAFPYSIDVHKTDPSRNNLFDLCYGGRLDQSSGGGIAPRHANGLTIWNFKQYARGVDYDFVTKDYIRPHIIGLHGEPAGINLESAGIVESFGTPVLPESLFEAQLRER